MRVKSSRLDKDKMDKLCRQIITNKAMKKIINIGNNLAVTKENLCTLNYLSEQHCRGGTAVIKALLYRK